MKGLWKALAIGTLAFAALAGGEPKGEEIVGWVSDENCGALHTKPGGADCVQKCIKGAPHLNPEWVAQRMVFVTDGDQAIWIVHNPEMLTGDEGQHLRIQAIKNEDAEEKSLRVLSKLRIDESEER